MVERCGLCKLRWNWIAGETEDGGGLTSNGAAGIGVGGLFRKDIT